MAEADGLGWPAEETALGVGAEAVGFVVGVGEEDGDWTGEGE